MAPLNSFTHFVNHLDPTSMEWYKWVVTQIRKKCECVRADLSWNLCISKCSILFLSVCDLYTQSPKWGSCIWKKYFCQALIALLRLHVINFAGCVVDQVWSILPAFESLLFDWSHHRQKVRPVEGKQLQCRQNGSNFI